MRRMSKDDFLSILDRQQQSGLTIKDFCENECYSVSCFHYWKSKYGLNRPYGSGSPSSAAAFAPVSLRSSFSSLSKGLPEDSPLEGAISIEFPNGVKIHFRGTSESDTALQVITQLCHRHVLPE
ncbi:IS66 family insertion sequence element accessory protein TnpA [uncultured Bacteroides sp.]|uniref:IS66 family insertion sequence element accessory protein TnpA n=1 Tax=uncultured Bacteroides sp. TaxID=162156 RepID=UPI002AA6A01E|nr:IS66 family insertion sequence element accessory protein TnpB [uncultured Bacteroides sp.]